jgi:CRP/FNR family transcriptional regulator, cyclic AMP receptor protein
MAEESDRRAAAAVTLSGVKVLHSVPDDERRYLETRCVFRRVPAGETLLSRFKTGTGVFFVIAGRARVIHYLEDGEDVTIATIADGDAIGELSAIDGGTASASVVAEGDCFVAELPKEDFMALLLRRGEVAVSLLRRWAGIIRDLDDKVSRVSNIGPRQRVYSEIIRLARVERPGSEHWVVAEMPSHQELANRTQTTREAVAGAIAELASRGIAERRTHALLIYNYRGLKDLLRNRAPPPPSVLASNP